MQWCTFLYFVAKNMSNPTKVIRSYNKATLKYYNRSTIYYVDLNSWRIWGTCTNSDCCWLQRPKTK